MNLPEYADKLKALAAAGHAAPQLDALAGYLNFSQGKPDPRFQANVNELFALLEREPVRPTWRALVDLVLTRLYSLQQSGTAAFRDVRQAEQVLSLVYDDVLPAYRKWHRDLLFHQTEESLFQPFFLARVFEAVLACGAPWDERKRIADVALKRLNDFVGYRPVPVLETQPRGEPYEHERVRPVPLYIRGAGVACGRYHDLIARAIAILEKTDPDLLHEAHLHLELLDELAFDPRAYDHQHPSNRRPNHVFGEWDPHHLDNQGRHRRYVVRQFVLDALLAHVYSFEMQVSSANPRPEAHNVELEFESAAVLSGTMLMGAGICGTSPTTHDSTVSLSKLMPIVANVRDTFYRHLLERLPGAHGERLRDEAKRTRQPLGGVRQQLNQFLANHRAEQLQQRQLALTFAVMGYPEASREQAARIPVASVRILSEILSRLTTGQLLTDRHELAETARVLPEIEDLLERGIHCGALVDPWNILGFQGQFPLFAAVEDTVQDPRVPELLHVMEQVFALYSRLLSEAAAAGARELGEQLRPRLTRLAEAWDRYATVEVGGLPRVHGGEAAESAAHVAKALAHWRQRGEQAADLAFWRDHLADFSTPKAFALVVDALLRKHDYKAAHGLLMNWLSQAEQIPLEEGPYSFHVLALRWMLEVTGGGERADTEPLWPLVQRFFAHLEANADVFWEVPELDSTPRRAPDESDEDGENPYEAAYENVTFRGSTDDGVEGSLQEGGPQAEPFDLEIESETLQNRVLFLQTTCRLWQIASRQARRGGRDERAQQVLEPWKATALHFQERLLTLLEALHAHPLPAPIGTHESLVEYDRRRSVKEQLLDTVIATCVEATLAVRALRGATEAPPPIPADRRGKKDWEVHARHLGAAILRDDAERARQVLPGFVQAFQHEPLLYVPLDAGGDPRQILRHKLAQITLRSLLETLPRLGLLRETYQLLKTAREMELQNALSGRKITEFDRLFHAGFQAAVEQVVASARTWDGPDTSPPTLVSLLEAISQPFLFLWMEHSQSLRLSALEAISGEKDWTGCRKFIQRYGRDLFSARFMTLGNLRGILSHGVGHYLETLAEEPDPLHPIKLLDELDTKVKRKDAVRWLDFILQAVVENYDEYKDYNSTTSQSDYGENLHILLDFLRLKASYEREAWHLKPLAWVHETLARHGPPESALRWQGAFAQLTRDSAARLVGECRKLEQQHGVVLRTIADRIEERFVAPLAVDRLVALIEPAMMEARNAGADERSSAPAFRRLLHELEPFTQNPSGVGLDVPVWLRRIEAELARVRLAHTPVAALTQQLFNLPRRKLSKEEIEGQIRDWEK